MDAKAKRDARKARILNKGADRLAKLTKEARGDEAETLYGGSSSKGGASTTTSKADQLTGEAPLDTDDPPEIDISKQAEMDQDLNRAMDMFRQQQQQQQQQQGQGQGAQGPQDPFQQMMAAMMGGGGGSGDMPQGMPDLSQLFSSMQQQQGGTDAANGGMGSAPAAAAPRGKPLTDRLFSLIHTALVVFIGYMTFSSTFSGNSISPATTPNPLLNDDDEAFQAFAEKSNAMEYMDRIHKWASLAYYRPSVLDARYFNLNGEWLGLGNDVVSSGGEGCAEHDKILQLTPNFVPQPILYLLLTLTLTLTVLRMSIPSASRPQPSSLLFTLASQLPFPTLQWALKLGARYVNLLTTFLDDLALLIFALGMAVVYSVVVSGGGAGHTGTDSQLRAQSAMDVLGSQEGYVPSPQ